MAAEIVDDLDLSLGDRRGRGLGQRRSWASAEPFERRATPFNSADAVAGSWRQLVHSYRVHAALLDLVAILLVATPVMVALYEPRSADGAHDRRRDARLRRPRRRPARLRRRRARPLRRRVPGAGPGRPGERRRPGPGQLRVQGRGVPLPRVRRRAGRRAPRGRRAAPPAPLADQAADARAGHDAHGRRRRARPGGHRGAGPRGRPGARLPGGRRVPAQRRRAADRRGRPDDRRGVRRPAGGRRPLRGRRGGRRLVHRRQRPAAPLVGAGPGRCPADHGHRPRGHRRPAADHATDGRPLAARGRGGCARAVGWRPRRPWTGRSAG